MKRNLILLFILTMAVQVILAQKDSLYPKLVFKTNLTEYCALNFPTINLAVEKTLNRKNSISATLGIQVYSFRRNDTLVFPNRGFKSLIEARHYFKKVCNGVYIGSQLFFRQDQYTARLYYEDPINTNDFITKRIGVKRKCIGGNVILGFENRIGSGVYIDAFIGLGAMYRNLKNPFRDYSKDDLLVYPGTDLLPYFTKQNRSESSGVALSVTLGLQLGIAF